MDDDAGKECIDMCLSSLSPLLLSDLQPGTTHLLPILLLFGMNSVAHAVFPVLNFHVLISLNIFINMNLCFKASDALGTRMF